MSDQVMEMVDSARGEMRCKVCGRFQKAKFNLAMRLLPESRKCQRGCQIKIGEDGQVAGFQRSSRRSRGPGEDVFV